MTKGTSGHPFVTRALVLVLSFLATAFILCVFPLMEAMAPSPIQVKQPKPIPVQIKYLGKQAPSVQQMESTVQDMRTTSKRVDAVSLPAPIAAPPSTPLPDSPSEHSMTESLAIKAPVAEPPATEPPVVEPPATEPPATEPPATEPPAAEQPAAKVSESTIPSNTTTPDDEKGSNQPTATMTGTDIPSGDSLKHPPRPMKHVQPRYPERARRLSIEGYVILRFVIDAKGIVTSPTIHQSVPSGVFDNAAIRAVRQWRFEPGRGDDGKPVPCQLQQRFDFRLENSR